MVFSSSREIPDPRSLVLVLFPRSIFHDEIILLFIREFYTLRFLWCLNKKINEIKIIIKKTSFVLNE